MNITKAKPDTPYKIFNFCGFKFELFESPTNSLAYRFFDNDIAIVHNLGYFPSKKAMLDDEVMKKELIKIILNEKNRNPEGWKYNTVEENFVKSKRFKDLEDCLKNN